MQMWQNEADTDLGGILEEIRAKPRSATRMSSDVRVQVKHMQTRENAADTDFEGILEEEVAADLKEIATISMGTEISPDDMSNITALCDQVGGEHGNEPSRGRSQAAAARRQGGPRAVSAAADARRLRFRKGELSGQSAGQSRRGSVPNKQCGLQALLQLPSIFGNQIWKRINLKHVRSIRCAGGAAGGVPGAAV